MNNMTTTAMNIILEAGEGRKMLQEALDDILNSEYENAKNIIDDAEDKIRKAHTIHTKFMQKAIEQDEEKGSTILFSHAQDTLMTINTEFLLIKKMVMVFHNLEKRIENIEVKINVKK